MPRPARTMLAAIPKLYLRAPLGMPQVRVPVSELREPSCRVPQAGSIEFTVDPPENFSMVWLTVISLVTAGPELRRPEGNQQLRLHQLPLLHSIEKLKASK